MGAPREQSGEVRARQFRLVATDLDGTLLDNTGKISPRTASALRHATRTGAVIVVATGRPLRALSPLRDMGFTGTVIAQNGAVLYDLGAGRRRVRGVIDPVSLRDFVRELSETVPGVQIAVQTLDETGEGFFADEGFPLDGYARLDRKSMVRFRIARALLWHPGPSVHLSDIADALARGRVHITRSRADGLVEVSASGVNKGAALADLAGTLGIDRKSVIAFGDMPNDREMLEWAGTGVAMKNAESSVFTVADATTGSNEEDGVAVFLERAVGYVPAGVGTEARE